MYPTVYSYTNPVTGSDDTTINSGSPNFTCKILNTELVQEADANYTKTGDGEEPILTAMISKGRILELSFTCMQTNERDGFDLLAAMFNKFDKRTKTLKILDADDSNRSYYVYCRNKGVLTPNGRTVRVRVALVSEYLLTTNTTTESTWTNASSGTKAVTIDKGNVSALPIIDLTPSAANTNGNKFWRFGTVYNYTRNAATQYPIEITAGGLDTASLINFSSISFTTSAYNASTTSITYTAVTGSFPTSFPYMIYNPATGEQMRVTARSGTTSGTLTVVRAIGGSTAASGSGAVNYSKMMKDGSDIRIYIGSGSGSGIETPYWFGGAQGATGGMNTSATKIWIPYNISIRALGTLSATISSGATSCVLTSVEGNTIPVVGGLLLFSDGEIASYDSYDAASGTFSGLTRASRGTSAASHTAATTVRIINDIRMCYGNASATAPDYTAAQYVSLKPVFSLNSTNDIWTYGNFASIANNTAYEWKNTQLGATDLIYTADASGVGPPFVQPTPADPNSIMGISLITKGHSAEWYLQCPFGVTALSTTTLKRSNLPANHAFLRVLINSTIIGMTAVATQANTWSTNTSLSVSATGYKASFFLQNIATTSYARRAAVQIDSLSVTMSGATTDATLGRPYVALSAEQTIDFDMDGTITNTTTGESIRIVRPDVAVGSSVRINTLLKTMVYTADNSNAFSNLQRYPARSEWLQLLQGTNTLSFDQAGVDIIISWQGRNNSFG